MSTRPVCIVLTTERLCAQQEAAGSEEALDAPAGDATPLGHAEDAQVPRRQSLDTPIERDHDPIDEVERSRMAAEFCATHPRGVREPCVPVPAVSDRARRKEQSVKNWALAAARLSFWKVCTEAVPENESCVKCRIAMACVRCRDCSGFAAPLATLLCAACDAEQHKHAHFHKREMWDGGFFAPIPMGVDVASDPLPAPASGDTSTELRVGPYTPTLLPPILLLLSLLSRVVVSQSNGSSTFTRRQRTRAAAANDTQRSRTCLKPCSFSVPSPSFATVRL